MDRIVTDREKRLEKFLHLWQIVAFLLFTAYVLSMYFAGKELKKQEPKTEYSIELLNQEDVRINNDTVRFEDMEEHILRDNL